jgi:ubiquinone biosynthesis protein Coq4
VSETKIRYLYFSSLHTKGVFRVGTQARFLPGVLYEKRWEQNITDFRREMNIEEPPSLK